VMNSQLKRNSILVSSDIPTKNRKIPFVERTDPHVELGFQRLSRLLQIKRLPLDKIQDELLEEFP